MQIGDAGVGKGSLMCRYGKDQFPPDKELKRKQGIYFKVKYVSIDGKRIKVQIWDTAGQERFRAITMSYFKATQGVLLVYDVTDRESFMKVETWITEIHRVSILDSSRCNYGGCVVSLDIAFLHLRWT